MSTRITPRECKKCGDTHVPPLIDDLCMKSVKSGREDLSKGTDGTAMAEQDLNGAVSALAECVQSMDNRIGSLEGIIKEYFLEKKSKLKKKKKSKRKAPLPSPSSTSSSSSSEYESVSGESDGSSSAGASAGDRGRSKSKKTPKHRSSAASLLRKSEFTHKPYIIKGKPVVNFERLMVCSLRMTKAILESGRGVSGLLSHLVVLAEKAATGYYRVDSIIAYDRATRLAAAEDGIGQFSIIDNSRVLQHLCYDASANASKGDARGVDKPHKSSKSRGLCYRFNKVSGCDRDKCRYLHVCSNCGDGAHGLFGCRKPKYQGATGGSGMNNSNN